MSMEANHKTDTLAQYTAEDVYQILRGEIISLRLLPGSVITETPPPTSPKTGESDALLYGVGAAAVCGTVMVVSGRKLKKS